MYEIVCKNGNKILSEVELPKRGGVGKHVNWAETIGMNLWLTYDKNKYDVKIVKYDKSKQRLYVKCNKDVLHIHVSSFLSGHFGGILNIDLNNKYIDEDGVVHIHITNTKGEEFEALYSGNHVDEVMKANWYACINCNNKIYRVVNNNNGYLHRIDFKNTPSHIFIDHINNNPLDNRIDNLRVSTQFNNCRNKISKNNIGITSIFKNGNGWHSSFVYDGHSVLTNTKHYLEEAKLDNLIAQRYLGYKHNEDLFYLLDGLDEERVKEVTDLLDKKIENNKNKILKQKEYSHDIEEKDGCYILHWNGKEMLFDCDLEFIKNMRFVYSNNYWNCHYVNGNKKITAAFHRELLQLKPNQYREYRIHVDHINNNTFDNRINNLIITTTYGNMCNKKGAGIVTRNTCSYRVTYMCNYRFWELIGETKRPSFQTEQEAIDEVNRRKEIVENARVKLHSKEELDELITYCFKNNYIQDNGLADLDLGYLYWKGILKRVA